MFGRQGMNIHMKFIWVLIICGCMATPLLAEVFTSLSLQEGYNSNIYYNSTEKSSSVTSFSSDLIFYPSDAVELSIFGDYIFYPSANELSNYLLGGSFTFIPTDDYSKSKITIYTTGSTLRYQDIFEIYSNNYAGASCSWQYSLTPAITISSGVSANYFDYPNTEAVTDFNYSFFGGFNVTFLKNNALNFDISYLEQEFSYNTFDTIGSFQRLRPVENKDTFSSTDYSVRFSRPLDIRTGFNCSYQKRSFDANQEFTYTGFELDYLSPVASLWNGDMYSAGLKRFLPFQIIGNLKMTYTEKTYTQISDFKRVDIRRSADINLQKTYLSENRMIIPQLQVRYLSQSSTFNLYDYSLIDLSLSATLMF